MPHIAITLGAGRSPEQVRDLIHQVHRAVLGSIGTRPEHIRIAVHEVARSHWATADLTLSEMDAAASPTPDNEAAPEE